MSCKLRTLLCKYCIEFIVDCRAPPQPANGQVSYNETVYGAIANYSCNTLYDIVGDPSRECLANGTWSGIEPRCELDNLEAIIGTVVVFTVVIILSALILIVFCILYCWRRVKLKLPVNEDETFENRYGQGLQCSLYRKFKHNIIFSSLNSTQNQSILFRKFT